MRQCCITVLLFPGFQKHDGRCSILDQLLRLSLSDLDTGHEHSPCRQNEKLWRFSFKKAFSVLLVFSCRSFCTETCTPNNRFLNTFITQAGQIHRGFISFSYRLQDLALDPHHHDPRLLALELHSCLLVKPEVETIVTTG